MDKIFYALLIITFFLTGCKKEEQIKPTEDLGISEMFSPPADENPMIKELYSKYGIWIRMDFDDWKKVTNAILDIDQINRWGVEKIEEQYKESALIYAENLLSNVSEKFSNSFFPLDLFFVKSYSMSFWAADIKRIGRSRLIVCWPNQMPGALPVTNSEKHYYKDSVLARQVWLNLAYMVAARMPEPISDFALAGKAYDNGEAYDRIMDEYYIDYDILKRDEALDELAKNGGFITGSGSRSFDNDFSDWMRLLATESASNIQAQYLDNSPSRAKKYEILIKYFQQYDWDIQSAGDKYRFELDN